VDDFFDRIMVMDDDPAVRANRLALLRNVQVLLGGVADLSRLPG
jgi:glycyl-tRNA synthetase beta chain